jgi:formylmethanofuran dehydrogenase subunit B
MPSLDFDAAVDRAAELLGAADFAVIAGLQTDVAGVVAAYRLAERIRGCVDHLAADAALRDQAVLQDGGLMAASPGTARARADVLLVVGDWPFAAWPEGRNFLLAEAPSRRQVILLSQAPIELPVTVDVSCIEAEPASLPGLLAALRARAHGRPLAADMDVARLDEVVALLKAASFGVALWSPAELDALSIETLMGLVKELNAETRWAGMSIAADPTITGCAAASGFMAALPLRVGFGAGYPEHDPWRFDARRLVAAGEVDAALWVSGFGALPPAWLQDLPCVILSDVAESAAAGRIVIPIGRPGMDHAGILYEARTGTLAERPAASPSERPSAAEILNAIAARLP